MHSVVVNILIGKFVELGEHMDDALSVFCFSTVQIGYEFHLNLKRY